jgi:hypothetical protein
MRKAVAGSQTAPLVDAAYVDTDAVPATRVSLTWFDDILPAGIERPLFDISPSRVANTKELDVRWAALMAAELIEQLRRRAVRPAGIAKSPPEADLAAFTDRKRHSPRQKSLGGLCILMQFTTSHQPPGDVGRLQHCAFGGRMRCKIAGSGY